MSSVYSIFFILNFNLFLIFLKDKEFVNSVLEKINADSLRSFLKVLSKEPHIAASDRDRSVVHQTISHMVPEDRSPTLLPVRGTGKSSIQPFLIWLLKTGAQHCYQ